MTNINLLLKKFIYSRKNLGAISIASMIFVLYVLGVIEAYWWQLAIGFYITAYMAIPKEKETIFIHVKGENLNDYKGFLLKLKQNTSASLPGEANEVLYKIYLVANELIDFIDKKPEGIDSLNEEIINIKRIFDNYLPTLLNQYIKLPKRYAENIKTSTGKTSRQMLFEQLNTLSSAIEKIAFALYENDVTKLKIHGKILDQQFKEKNLFILEKEING